MASGRTKELFEAFEVQLREAGYALTGGQIVDSTMVEVPRQRNTREENVALKQGDVPEDWKKQPRKLAQKDVEATWTKKHGVSHYGYKNHVTVDRQYKLARDYETTTASTPAIPHELRACLILGDFTVGEERLSRTLERFSVLREWFWYYDDRIRMARRARMEANPRSLRKMRKQLSAPGLLDLARGYFEQVKDPCVGRCEYTLADTLMSGLAMFLFKSSSMLQFERGCRGVAADPVLQHNLKRLYGVAKVPSDSRLRRRLDGVSPRAIAFEIYSSCRAARTMSRRKSVSQPARLSLPRMESLSGCTRAIFRASRRNSARLDGPWSLRLR